MKRTLILMSLLLLLIFAVAAETITTAGGANSVTVISSSGTETVLQYRIGKFEQTPVNIAGAEWFHINLPNEGITQDKGFPQLPVFNRSIIIDNTARMRLEFFDIQYQDFQVPVAPSKGVIYRNTDPATVPYTFGDVYQRDEFYPQSVAELTEPYILRDYRGIVVQTTPFAYNPVSKTLRVYTAYKVRVYASGTDTLNTLTRSVSSISRDFVSLYENQFLNWENFRYTPVSDAFGKMLVICHTNYMSTILPYVNWKIQKGIPTELVQWSTIGTTAAQLQTYIQNRYIADPTIAYIQLVGDAPQIPSLASGGGGSDPSFSLVAGTDNYPDIFIGRFSAETTAQVTTQINKAIVYERDASTSDTWLSKAVGIASAEGGGSQGDNGESDIQHMNNIRTKLLNYGYSSVDQIYDPGASAATVTTNINAGRGFLNYVGHGSDTSWGTTGFNNTNATNLTNGNKTPFIMDVACVNGNFVSITCFAEAWLRNANGGAVAMYAGSINQSWNSPMLAEDEVTILLTAEAKYTTGGLYYNGSCKMMDTYGNTAGSDGVNMFKTWHIFGDASLSTRTKTPIAMTVTHPSNIVSGTSSVSVSTGVNNTLVSITYNNTIYGRGFTNSSGNATITLTSPPTGVINYTITGSAHNRVTYVGTIAQTVASGPWMEVTTANYDDANNDLPEYNESGYFDVTFKNSGTSTASNVSATLSCSTSGITVTDASHSISSLVAGASTVADNAYAISIANNVANGTVANFTITMVSGANTWTYNFTKTISAPALAFGNMTISDPTGNNNGMLDPGETATVSIVLNNTGGAASLPGTGTLNCSTSGITIVNGSASFSAISAAGYTSLSFTVTAASSMNAGTLAAFVFNAVAGAYSANTTVNVEVGAPLEVIIGGGSSTQTYPIDRYYTYSGHEAIYLASEIGTPGTIKSLGFYKASGTDVNTIEAVTVYMKNTTATTLATGNYSTTGYTQVYNGTWPNTATSGWMEVNLNTQFVYDGTNLSILTIKGNQTWISNYPMWTYTSASANRARQNRDDNSQPTSLAASTNLPNLKLKLFPIAGFTPPTIEIDNNALYANLQVGNEGTDSFTITNTGSQALTYDISLAELRRSSVQATLGSAKGDRNINGSTLTLSAVEYTPGTTQNWTFTVYNGSSDAEWLKGVNVSFPTGVTVNSVTNFVGGSGGDLAPTPTSGNGVTIEWYGANSYGYGPIHGSETATATVNVSIAPSFGGTMSLPFEIVGDVYGATPHTLTGTFTVPQAIPPLAWFSAQPLSGSIPAGQSQLITGYFSAIGMAVGTYEAALTINSNDPVNPTLLVDVQMDVWDDVSTDPLIAVTPSSVSGTADAGSSSTATLTVRNTGGSALNWSTPSSFAAWGTVTPTSGTIAAGGNTVLTLTLNAAVLSPNTYNANLVISSNAQNNPSLTVPATFTVTAVVVPSDIRFIAEWEPATGVIIAYASGFGLPFNMIADLSNRGQVYVLGTSGNQSTATSQLSSNGVNMSNVSYIVRNGIVTYWTRDYGPWSIFDANGEMAIVDFRYNRTRPYDNAVNAVLDDYLGFNYSYMPLVATGGNVMTDGNGKMMSTTLIQTENDGVQNSQVTEYSYTLSQIQTLVQDYLGVDEYFMYADPLSNSSIDHIDCHAKLLDVDKVMIARVPTGHANYTALEATVATWQSKTSSYGTPYQIFRVNQSNANEPYANSFIFNNKIYVPQWNATASSYDTAAIAAYQVAMPGYTVQGYYDSSFLSDDAAHCRVNTIYDEQMLHVWHMPPSSATANSSIPVNVDIKHSNPLNAASTYVSYRHSTTGQWQNVTLSYVSGDTWTAQIPTPAMGQTLYYYILATDTTARNATMPLCGASDPFKILVNIPGGNTAPTIALPTSFTFPEDGSLVVDFSQYVNDVDGDALTLSYSENTEVIVSITGLSVTFTATADWHGTENLTFTVSDGSLTANDNVNVIVTSVIDPAVILVAPLSLAYGEVEVGSTDVKTFTITNNGEATLTGNISTPAAYSVVLGGRSLSEFGSSKNGKEERNTLAYSIATGVTKTYNLSFAPTAAIAYNGNVTVTSNDPNNPTTNIVITGMGHITNTAPTIALPSSFNFPEDGSLVVDFSQYVDDINGDALTLSHSGGTHVTVSINGLSVTFGATADWNGTETITFTVGDGELSASDAANVIVTPVNDAPTIALPASFSFAEDGTLTVDFAPYVNDIETPDSALTLSYSGGTNVTVSIDGLNVTFGATADWNGTEAITFTVGDGELSASDATNVIVTPVNDAPTIALPASFSFAEEGSLVVDFSQYLDDVDNDTLTLSYSGATNVTVSIDGLNVTFGAAADWNGTETITFTVGDGELSASDEVDVIVTPVNDAPTIALPEYFEFDMNGSLAVDFSPYVDDVDGDELSLSYSGNTNVSVSIDGLMVTFSAGNDWCGTENLTFTVSDGYSSASDAVNVNVILTHLDTPIISSIIKTSTGIQIQWLPVNNAKSYRVYRSFDPYGEYTDFRGTTAQTVFVDAAFGDHPYAFYMIVATDLEYESK